MSRVSHNEKSDFSIPKYSKYKAKLPELENVAKYISISTAFVRIYVHMHSIYPKCNTIINHYYSSAYNIKGIQ